MAKANRMPVDANQEWFETVETGGKLIRVSKFLREDFAVPIDFINARWQSLTLEERTSFACAFAARRPLGDNDQELLDFLMKNGEPRIWRTIALSVVRHRDQGRAVNFLLSRINENVPPLANYYQAICYLSASECIPALRQAITKHRIEVAMHPTLEGWADRFIYLDYLYCAAALLITTGQQEYRAELVGIKSHPDEVIRQMVQMVLTTSSIESKEE
jgi:hypothetical protein